MYKLHMGSKKGKAPTVPLLPLAVLSSHEVLNPSFVVQMMRDGKEQKIPKQFTAEIKQLTEKCFEVRATCVA
jgi:hypothetical protein